eukprot:COSAG01_NODE_5708_length_4085_cov_6.491972_3_plen_182_part_00
MHEATQRGALCVFLRARGEIMGSRKYEHVGKSQSVLIMINPMISPRTRKHMRASPRPPSQSRPSSPGRNRDSSRNRHRRRWVAGGCPPKSTHRELHCLRTAPAWPCDVAGCSSRGLRVSPSHLPQPDQQIRSGNQSHPADRRPHTSNSRQQQLSSIGGTHCPDSSLARSLGSANSPSARKE